MSGSQENVFLSSSCRNFSLNLFKLMSVSLRVEADLRLFIPSSYEYEFDNDKTTQVDTATHVSSQSRPHTHDATCVREKKRESVVEFVACHARIRDGVRWKKEAE